MEKLKTIVYNKTVVPLSFKAYHKDGKTEADLKEIKVSAGKTNKIHFEDLFKGDTQEVHVESVSKQFLHIFNRHDFDFPKEKMELLILEMLEDGCLQHTFVQWTWDALLQTKNVGATATTALHNKLKTKVDNKTELKLKFIDVYKVGGASFYGIEKTTVPAGGTKTIYPGAFLKEQKYQKSRDKRTVQKIHVMSGDHVVLIMSSDDFQKNQGMDLILDSHDDHFGFAFHQPINYTSWKNWLCFSKTRKSPDSDIFDYLAF